MPRSTFLARGTLAAAAALALLGACNPQVQGNGVYREESRERGAFTGVRVDDGVAVHVTSGAASQSIRVVGDSNLIQYIVTDVFDGEAVGTGTMSVLHVSVTESYVATITPSVFITVPALSYVRTEGASPVDVKKAAAPLFHVEAYGGSEVTLLGLGGALLDVTLADGGLDAGSYPVQGAWVALSGHSRADLNASGPVVGTASGTSLVDNMLGAGPCLVDVEGAATTACH